MAAEAISTRLISDDAGQFNVGIVRMINTR